MAFFRQRKSKNIWYLEFNNTKSHSEVQLWTNLYSDILHISALKWPNTIICSCFVLVFLWELPLSLKEIMFFECIYLKLFTSLTLRSGICCYLTKILLLFTIGVPRTLGSALCLPEVRLEGTTEGLVQPPCSRRPSQSTWHGIVSRWFLDISSEGDSTLFQCPW